MNNQQHSPEMEAFFDTLFPECEATKHFHRFPSVLEKYSPYALGITPQHYKELMTADGKFTYRLAGVVFNVLIAQTMKGMEMSLDEYVEFAQDIAISAKKWNDDIQAKQRETALAEAPKDNKIPLTKAEA